MKILRTLCAFTLLACAPPAVAQDDKDAPPKPVYEVEVRCYRILADVSDQAGESAGKPSTTVSTEDFEWGDLRLHIEGDTLEWNGNPEPPDDPRVELTANPKIRTFAGNKSTLSIGQDGIGYFEPTGTGDPPLFVYKTIDQPVGLELEVLVSETSRQGSVYVELNYSSSAVIGREELPGVSLNVGMPQISTYAFQTRVRTELNNWMGLGGSEGGQAALLTLLKVSEVD